MKRIFTILAALLITAVVFAQVPQFYVYQAVVRDNFDNQLMQNTVIYMRISFVQGSPTGTSVYVETQRNLCTNGNGVVTVFIGTGSVVYGNFANIDWSDGPYFIKSEISFDGIFYVVTMTDELSAVPYAMFAKRTEFGGYSHMVVFYNPGVYSFNISKDANYMIEVWGGGGGGGFYCDNSLQNFSGCGGGGGGYAKCFYHYTSGDSLYITIKVGAGGVGASTQFGGNGENGGTSSFSNKVSAEGGMGGIGLCSIGSTGLFGNCFSSGGDPIFGDVGIQGGTGNYDFGGDSPNGGSGGVQGANGLADGKSPGGGGAWGRLPDCNGYCGNGAEGRIVIYW